jgi:hypothetical protein
MNGNMSWKEYATFERFFKECKKPLWQLSEVCLASSLMAKTNEPYESRVKFVMVINIPTTSVCSIVYKITNMVMACMFEVMSNIGEVHIYERYSESNLRLF